MPELPEVETARRNAERHLVGRTITSLELTLPKLLRDSPIPELASLVGAGLVAARRRAKVLILDFENNLSLLIHFKLAGQLAIFPGTGKPDVAGHPIPLPTGDYPHKTTHVTFTFEDGTIAYYSDVRQFGWLRLMPTDDVAAAIDAFGFGPEGTEPLDRKSLLAVMARRGIPIKTLLLDQKYIAGLGNIYVDEVLFRSKVHPAIAANALSASKQRLILENIPPVLAEGIRQGGAKIIHNVAHPVDQFPAIHARVGEPCFVCGTTIEKIRVGGRGTYFCPKCQRIPPNVRKAAVNGIE